LRAVINVYNCNKQQATNLPEIIVALPVEIVELEIDNLSLSGSNFVAHGVGAFYKF